MTRQLCLAAAVAVAGLAAGCAETVPGVTRDLGPVQYASAFAAAREVMAQYSFSVETAEADTGIIQSRPKSAEEPRERILSGSPARQVATMRLRQEKGEQGQQDTVVAHLSIAVHRLGTAEHRRLRMTTDSYNTVPNQTPADADAATTAEQNEVWTIDRYDHVLARKILDDLYRRMHPATE